MYNKVEICGVNTATLKVLSEAEKTDLIQQMQQGDRYARERLVQGNLRLVLSVVQRFSGRGENPDDLFQVGCIGLIKSIDNFDLSQNVRFSTYAVPMIIGEIRRYLRDNNAIRISRSMRDIAYRAMQAKEQLLSEQQREPTIEEIATKLEEEKEKIVIVALVDTLDYLKMGGRVSKTVAFAGTLLNIKPVLSVTNGDIKMLGKARGSKQGNNLLVQEIEKAGGVDFTKPVLLGYTGLSDVLLLKYIEDSKHIWEAGLEDVRYTTIGSVIGTHAGPGAVAVAFFKN